MYASICCAWISAWVLQTLHCALNVDERFNLANVYDLPNCQIEVYTNSPHFPAMWYWWFCYAFAKMTFSGNFEPAKSSMSH